MNFRDNLKYDLLIIIATIQNLSIYYLKSLCYIKSYATRPSKYKPLKSQKSNQTHNKINREPKNK